MTEDEVKDLIQKELQESGYMYTLGMLRGCMLLGHLVRKNGIAMLSIYII